MFPAALASIPLSSCCRKKAARPAPLQSARATKRQVLDKPYSAAAVDAKSNIETKTITAEDANRTFADALAAQPPQPVSFTLYFETNSVEVTPASRPTLDALFAEVAKRTAVEVQVTGHTDRVGSVADNDRLSLQRAEAVRAMLIQRGINSSFLRAVGRGEREPLIPTRRRTSRTT